MLGQEDSKPKGFPRLQDLHRRIPELEFRTSHHLLNGRLLRLQSSKVPSAMALPRRTALLTTLALLAVVLLLGRPTLAEEPTVPDDHAAIEAKYFAWIDRVANRSAIAANAPQVAPVDAVVFASGVANIITVGKSGANYQTVQAAVNAVPKNNKNRIIIRIAAGTYKEKVDVPSSKPYITFEGAGRDVTKITWDDIAGDSSTFKSASVAINSHHFIASGITFENSAPSPPPGAVGKQAVALRISGDYAQFDSCGFLGAQDTLYDHKGRHYFKNSFIQGSIDYIFGDGQSIYQSCQLNSIAKATGSLTAQKRTSTSEDTGFSFINCKVTGTGMLYFGRAWGEASRVVFSYTNFAAKNIRSDGWNDWGDSRRQKTVFYGLYKCFGPGAVNNGFVPWMKFLTDAQAAPFITLDFINGKDFVSI